MNLVNDLIINSFRLLRILLQFVQNVKVLKSLLEKERHQNIDVTIVETNLMILKLRLFIQHKNKRMTLVNNTLILTIK